MDSIYKIIDVVGTSRTSWEDAAKNAVETAGKSLEDLRVGGVVKLDLVIEKAKVVAYRARVNISFKYRAEQRRWKRPRRIPPGARSPTLPLRGFDADAVVCTGGLHRGRFVAAVFRHLRQRPGFHRPSFLGSIVEIVLRPVVRYATTLRETRLLGGGGPAC